MAISIHAPRTGSDAFFFCSKKFAKNHFNPRSPHGERRATMRRLSRGVPNFNPRSPHGERRLDISAEINSEGFQSTLPARGATKRRKGGTVSTSQFQSTLPARGATKKVDYKEEKQVISIHAPRTGSDVKSWACAGYLKISIHAPRTGSDQRQRLVRHQRC